MATAPELNRNFASAIGADGLPVYAPAYIMVIGRLKLHPTAEDYAAHTPPCWPVVDVTPSPDTAPVNHHWEARGWTRDTERQMFVRQYEAVQDPPPPPRRWSRLSIKRTLVAEEKWDAVKSLMLGADKYDDFIMAQYIAEDDDAFIAVYEQAVAAYGKEAVDAILDQILAE